MSKTPAIDFELLCDRLFVDRSAALELLKQASDGLLQDVLATSSSIAALDFAEVARLGHKLRGSAGNLAAEPLSAIGDRLEKAAKACDSAALLQLEREFIAAAEEFRAAVRTLSEPA
jgi:HPt (histidine-containing phosphotransfer) domain-containing protein